MLGFLPNLSIKFLSNLPAPLSQKSPRVSVPGFRPLEAQSPGNCSQFCFAWGTESMPNSIPSPRFQPLLPELFPFPWNLAEVGRDCSQVTCLPEPEQNAVTLPNPGGETFPLTWVLTVVPDLSKRAHSPCCWKDRTQNGFPSFKAYLERMKPCFQESSGGFSPEEKYLIWNSCLFPWEKGPSRCCWRIRSPEPLSLPRHDGLQPQGAQPSGGGMGRS